MADASHELRSPLAAMRSEIDVTLRTQDLPTAARDALESTRDDVDQLSRTVDDLLTLARADEQGLRPVAEPLDLRQLASVTAASMGSLARERGVTIVVDGPEVFGLGDDRWLRQALRNLLDNAIRHSPPTGAVTIRTSNAAATAIVCVTDDGPGIPVELQERVFDRFFRVDEARTPGTRAGSGIGLSITREIARAHGGEAWVDSRPSGGSAVSISLPAATHSPRPDRA